MTLVRRVLFSSSSNTPAEEGGGRAVVFLHGRLEAPPGETPFDSPLVLYREFLDLLAAATGSGSSVYVMDFSHSFSHLSQEPRDLRLGPLSQAVKDSLPAADSAPMTTLVTFSMGAALGLKLLAHDDAPLDRVVLVEPVWRCWLPFVVASASYPRTAISNVPTLALWGTHDDETQNDSGKSVVGSLRGFLPQVQAQEIQGGNHWAILNEDLPLAHQGLGPGQTPSSIKREMMQHIAQFCGVQQDIGS